MNALEKQLAILIGKRNMVTALALCCSPGQVARGKHLTLQANAEALSVEIRSLREHIRREAKCK